MAGFLDALKKAALVARGAPAAKASGVAGAAGATGLGIMSAQGGNQGGMPAPTPTPTPQAAPLTTPTGGFNFGGATPAPTGDMGQSYLQNYLDIQNNPQFSYLTGGPNQGLINQLTELSKKKLQQYKENRADSENMYGQLTSKVEGFGTAIGQGYDSAISGTAQQGQASQQALSQELANQSGRRSNAFKELGIEREGALTNFGSDTALNEAMGNILSSSGSWQSLLQSQKQGAGERNKNLVTSIGNTLNQTILGMKEQYDAAKEAYDSQIASEKSKTATRKLNELGKMFSKGTLDQLKGYTFGSSGSTGQTDIQKKLANFDAVPSAKYGSPSSEPGGATAWYNKMAALAQDAYSADKAAYRKNKGVDPDIIRFAQTFGLGPYLGTNYSAFYGG